MKKENKGLVAAVTLFVITAVMALALAVVNGITADRIARIQEEKTRQALSGVLAEGVTLEEELPEFPDETGLVKAAYSTTDGYVIQVTPAGYGGAIDMVVGVSGEGTVTGIEIVSHSETASLGANIAQGSKGEAFRGQFVNQSGTLAVTKDGGSIDALTGATVSSRAVTKGVNAALACAAQLEGGNP